MSNQLFLFGKKSCAPCQSVKLFLNSQNIKHSYIDVEEEPDKASEAMIMSTPTLVVQDESGKEIDKVFGGNDCMAAINKYRG